MEKAQTILQAQAVWWATNNDTMKEKPPQQGEGAKQSGVLFQMLSLLDVYSHVYGAIVISVACRIQQLM